MKLPPQFAARPKPPVNRCSSCHKTCFVRDKGSMMRRCLFCGHTEVAPLRAMPPYIWPSRPERTVFRFAWE